VSFAPLNLDLWVDRLRSGVTGVQVIELAANIAAVKAFDKGVAPAIYVMRQTGTATDDSGSERITQIADVQVSILIVARRLGDPLGAKVGITADAIRAQVWTRLIGWQPTDAAIPVSIGTFRDEDWTDAVVYAYDTFKTTIFMRSP